MTKNLPTDSGVRQWSHPLMIHCIVCGLNQTTECAVHLNVTLVGFVLFWFHSFTCTVRLLFHSFLEMESFKFRGQGRQKKFGSRWTGVWQILKIGRFSRMLYVYRPLINFIDEQALLESRPPLLTPFYFLVRFYESIWIPKHSHRRAWKENEIIKKIVNAPFVKKCISCTIVSDSIVLKMNKKHFCEKRLCFVC